MAELCFAGLGLGDDPELDGPLRTLVNAAGAVLLDNYTSSVGPAQLEALRRLAGPRLQILDRTAAEEGGAVLAALAVHDRVLFLTAGDPFVATTHVELRLRAESSGHHWRYRPGASILSAVPSFLGLQHYRFGRVISIPFPADGYVPSSFVDRIAANRSAGLHSLVLLDLVPAEGRYLSADAALGILEERDPEFRQLPASLEVAVAARVGRADAAGWYGPRTELRRRRFGEAPHSLVVPAPELHFEEAAALERFRERV
ncbi:MAG: diphthine synthase [Thermoplasmata archaeon]|nr:diphthine synthase [Thermoplasmata archaeon]